MIRQQSFSNEKPTLYLVPTPIGNLEEMTPRAIEILRTVDVIAAEDTRNTMKLLQVFDIHTRMIAHHSHNERESASYRLIRRTKRSVRRGGFRRRVFPDFRSGAEYRRAGNGRGGITSCRCLAAVLRSTRWSRPV